MPNAENRGRPRKGEARKLNVKQELFIQAYVGAAKFNGAKAAEIAGYTAKHAKQAARDLLARPLVAERLNQEFEAIGKKLGVTHDEVIETVRRLIEKAETKDQFMAAMKGTELLAKFAGLIGGGANVNNGVVINNGVVPNDPEERKRLDEIYNRVMKQYEAIGVRSVCPDRSFWDTLAHVLTNAPDGIEQFVREIGYRLVEARLAPEEQLKRHSRAIMEAMKDQGLLGCPTCDGELKASSGRRWLPVFEQNSPPAIDAEIVAPEPESPAPKPAPVLDEIVEATESERVNGNGSRRHGSDYHRWMKHY